MTPGAVPSPATRKSLPILSQVKAGGHHFGRSTDDRRPKGCRASGGRRLAGVVIGPEQTQILPLVECGEKDFFRASSWPQAAGEPGLKMLLGDPLTRRPSKSRMLGGSCLANILRLTSAKSFVCGNGLRGESDRAEKISFEGEPRGAILVANDLGERSLVCRSAYRSNCPRLCRHTV